MVEASVPSSGTAATTTTNNNNKTAISGGGGGGGSLLPTMQPPVKQKKRVAIFQDAITVNIPIDVTVDLGVALRRTRQKRIAALYEAFPSLKTIHQESKKDDTEGSGDDDNSENSDDEIMEGTGDSAAAAEGGVDKKKKNKKKKTKPTNALVPQRHEFNSIVDYLEAKYTQGVMIHNENDPPGEEGYDDSTKRKGGDGDDNEDDDDDEGQGSVYSETSFLDDRDLQRDVAEQVLAQTTTTKLELEGDDDFFVNVGDLDVEETELTQKTYDPLEDGPTKTTTKKRKRPSGTKTTTPKPVVAHTNKKTVSSGKKNDEPVTKKKKKNMDGDKSPSTKKPETDDVESSGEDEDEAVGATTTSKTLPSNYKELKAEAAEHRNVLMKRFDTIKQMIKDLAKENLPRKKSQKKQVSITCPAGKKEGDEITFVNPHIPGQRLKVPVPKGVGPSGIFKVTVPTQPTEDDGVDHNKFPRELQDELDLYAREYDTWCKHEGDLKHARGETYKIAMEKQKKYDQVIKLFPKNLLTPIDDDYMKKLVRRARQNKSKRSKTAQAASAASVSSPGAKSQASSVKQEDASDDDEEEEEEEEEENEAADSADENEKPEHRTIKVPQRGSVFPKMQFNIADFSG